MSRRRPLPRSRGGGRDVDRGRFWPRAGNPVARLMRRAQESGDLRRDASLEDLFLMFWGIARTIGITGHDAPDQLYRQVAIALDGLRARPGQSPLPGNPVTKDQLDRLIGDWSEATLVRRRCS